MNVNTSLRGLAAAGAALLVGACGSGSGGPGAGGGPGGEQSGTPASEHAASGSGQQPVPTDAEDWQGVTDALGRQGKVMGGTVYRVGFPRGDLKVTSYGVQVKPGLALGSYAAFARYPDGQNLAMGDLVVTEKELPKVTDALHKSGIDQTAVHKHLLAHEPQIWWTHFHASGKNAEMIAQGLKTALDATGTPPPAEPASPGPIDLDTQTIDKALGAKGTNDGGIYKFSFARNQTVTAHGKVLPPATGVTTAINFQPTGDGKAAINGDFAMTAGEVQNVIEVLRSGGIDIVELHNHALDDNPRLFYLHFWAVDDAAKLARTLGQAVDEQDVKPVG
ncbi:DUF1259 domain-containing protein [Streptomyces himalayensis]|uniref:DUF1259 domain-containing protein n=1 Tax=Streptomyces himalayensis TaxID=2820085 RepID=UPI001C69C1CB|nr:DUF1259 domain-containing protein [Streptomyces himalayensis]